MRMSTLRIVQGKIFCGRLKSSYDTAIASNPMTRLLNKPIVFLLVVGLVGCTTTRWRVFEPSESATPIPHVRVTFMSGSQFEAYDAIITRETISGTTKDGESFAVPIDEVRTIEVDSGSKIDIVSTGGAFFGVLLLGLLPFLWFEARY